MTSLRAWLTDQIVEALRPFVDASTRDILDRLRVDATIHFHIEE